MISTYGNFASLKTKISNHILPPISFDDKIISNLGKTDLLFGN